MDRIEAIKDDFRACRTNADLAFVTQRHARELVDLDQDRANKARIIQVRNLLKYMRRAILEGWADKIGTQQHDRTQPGTGEGDTKAAS